MLSENIYSLRRKSGMSQEQLAEKIGVSRQAISKWEGGLSTPELDKLKSLSECFQVSIDELTGNQTTKTSEDAAMNVGKDVPRKAGESFAGILLCSAGAVCLILFGVLTVFRPSAVSEINDASMIVLNGTGIFVASSVLFMILGIILIFKKK